MKKTNQVAYNKYSFGGLKYICPVKKAYDVLDGKQNFLGSWSSVGQRSVYMDRPRREEPRLQKNRVSISNLWGENYSINRDL